MSRQLPHLLCRLEGQAETRWAWGVMPGHGWAGGHLSTSSITTNAFESHLPLSLHTFLTQKASWWRSRERSFERLNKFHFRETDKT